MAEFEIPVRFRGRLFEFEETAVKIVAGHLEKRRGVVMA